MKISRINIELLGQSGCRLSIGKTVVYIDPYLSNSVQEMDSPDLYRLRPIPFLPETVTDATWILITHDHLDHCDPKTVPLIAKFSPQAKIIAPSVARDLLVRWGIDEKRIFLAKEEWTELDELTTIRAVPAAHPTIERDTEGRLRCVGYLLCISGEKVYFAGDTSVSQELLDTLLELGPIHTAFLPVNEHNYFLNRRGIVGNMTLRESMSFADEVGVKQFVPVHWDMFACNSVTQDEIHLVYRQIKPRFNLVIHPSAIILDKSVISIIIRTFNEEAYIDELITSIEQQDPHNFNPEIVLVDSGSTDRTIEIAHGHGCKIKTIKRSEFSFGRSLNIGCEAATGDVLVFISGHCVPTDNQWLSRLCKPLLDGQASYVYGRQIGSNETRVSENRIFSKYFPPHPVVSKEDFYCNNANSAILREVWQKYRFDEELTGLEDIELAQRVVRDGGSIRYIEEALVVHHHNETWKAVRRRFEREAIALQKIMPQIHVGFFDMMRYFISSVIKDYVFILKNSKSKRKLIEIILYRWNQYQGTYLGNRELRKLSHAEKEKYFYPA